MPILLNTIYIVLLKTPDVLHVLFCKRPGQGNYLTRIKINKTPTCNFFLY